MAIKIIFLKTVIIIGDKMITHELKVYFDEDTVL